MKMSGRAISQRHRRKMAPKNTIVRVLQSAQKKTISLFFNDSAFYCVVQPHPPRGRERKRKEMTSERAKDSSEMFLPPTRRTATPVIQAKPTTAHTHAKPNDRAEGRDGDFSTQRIRRKSFRRRADLTWNTIFFLLFFNYLFRLFIEF